MTLVSVKNLSFYYDREKVLNEVNFEVNPGEFVILTGENGAAKSTLLKNILGLLKPASGTVTIAKTNALGKPLSIGYVPQNVNSFNAGFNLEYYA